MRRIIAMLGLAALPGLAAPGCLYDSDSRCGDNQSFDGTRCVCSEGFGLVNATCQACGDHAVGSADGCTCETGYMRLTTDGPCEADTALGEPCASDADCTEARYPYCRIEADGGYCTSSGCTTYADCVGDYGCNTRETPSFCERPPSGLGTPCTSSTECADFAAPYCETVIAHSCLVNDCKVDPNKCHGDWVCCDIALLSQSLCMPPSELTDGACPGGGTLVPRGG
jgi:hypothetical protein